MKTKIILLFMISLLILGCRSIDPDQLEQAYVEHQMNQPIKVPKLIGEGEVLTPSDYAVIYFRTGAITATEESAIEAGNKSMHQMMDALIEAGVKESNIKYEGGIEAGPYYGPGGTSSGFKSQPLVSVHIDDMENLRKYLDALVPFYRQVWVEFELTEANKNKAGKEALKLAEEDIRAKGASSTELLFAKKHFDQELSRIRKYPEIAYAASVEQTLEEAKNVDLTPKPVKTKAQIAILQTIDPKDVPDYPGN